MGSQQNKFTEKKPKEAGVYRFRYWRYNNPDPYEYTIEIFEDSGKLYVHDGENVTPLSKFGKKHPISPVCCEYLKIMDIINTGY